MQPKFSFNFVSHAWMIIIFLSINPVPVCSLFQGRGISQLGEHLANFLRDWGELNGTSLTLMPVKTFILESLDLLLRGSVFMIHWSFQSGHLSDVNSNWGEWWTGDISQKSAACICTASNSFQAIQEPPCLCFL